MQMTRNTVSDSNKATTFRQLNRTVPFLAQPACKHTVWEWFWKKILQSSVAQFEFSCTYLAHRHGIQRNVGLTFFIWHLQTIYIFATFFTLFNVFFKFLFERFTSMLFITVYVLLHLSQEYTVYSSMTHMFLPLKQSTVHCQSVCMVSSN